MGTIFLLKLMPVQKDLNGWKFQIAQNKNLLSEPHLGGPAKELQNLKLCNLYTEWEEQAIQKS